MQEQPSGKLASYLVTDNVVHPSPISLFHIKINLILRQLKSTGSSQEFALITLKAVDLQTEETEKINDN